jgi:dienelactone hydrolase
MSRRRTLALLLAPLAVPAILYVVAHDFFEAAALVVRAGGIGGVARRLAALEADAVTETVTPVAWRGGTLRGRTYTPAHAAKRPILLVPGVHAGGFDEPRLVWFAREIAATGHPVVTVDLPDLRRYEITPRTTDMIEDAAAATAQAWAPRLAAGERAVGLMGISFGGGLAVVAASRPGAHAAWVLSVGGHGDLPRTLRYLCTGEQPDGTHRPPHDYGVVIILLAVADRLVPAAQVEPLREGIHTFLEASHLDMVDKPRAAIAFARAGTIAEALPEPARTFMNWVNTRDVGRLGPALLPHVTAAGGAPALSPERNPAPAVPVYLLHGADDNVIPAAESARLAGYLRARDARVVRLSTPLITHAEVDRPPGVVEIWQLVRFWARPL